MRIKNIEEINKNIKDNPLRYIIKSEEFYHNRIVDAITDIALSKGQYPVVCLAGPSGSGKTTTALRIKEYLSNLGINVITISMDNYYLPAYKRVGLDLESPECIDIELLNSHLLELSSKPNAIVKSPIYSFKKGDISRYQTIKRSNNEIILFEGLHALNPLIVDPIKDYYKGIYIAPRTNIKIEDETITPKNIRLIRRLLRDYNYRGSNFAETVLNAERVNAGESKYIAPYKSNASIYIDTFLDYEPAVLIDKLNSITPSLDKAFSDEFIKKHNLQPILKLAKEIELLKLDNVPKNSVIREFAGGSTLKY